MGLVERWKLWRFGLRNTLSGRPALIRGRLRLDSGGDNRIEFGTDVILKHVTITFKGRGNTLRFGDGATVQGRFSVSNGGSIEIGARTVLAKACWMQAHEGKTIRIGADCLLADVRIRTSDMHKVLDVKTMARLNNAANVTVADHVWIAEGVSIYKGAAVGEHSVVGAHAVVTGNIPSNSVAVGCPAKVVRQDITWKR